MFGRSRRFLRGIFYEMNISDIIKQHKLRRAFAMAEYIMALDAGTTSNRCILFDRYARVCAVAQKEFTPKAAMLSTMPTKYGPRS